MNKYVIEAYIRPYDVELLEEGFIPDEYTYITIDSQTYNYNSKKYKITIEEIEGETYESNT